MSGDEPGCHRQEVGVKGFSGVGGGRSGARADFSRDGAKLAALPVSVLVDGVDPEGHKRCITFHSVCFSSGGLTGLLHRATVLVAARKHSSSIYSSK